MVSLELSDGLFRHGQMQRLLANRCVEMRQRGSRQQEVLPCRRQLVEGFIGEVGEERVPPHGSARR